MRKLGLSLLACIALSVRAAAADNPSPLTDARYFDHARADLWQDLEGVLSLRIAYEKSQSRGERRISLYSDPNIGSTRILECRDLEPLSDDPDSEDSSAAEAAATRVCGVRLLGWSAGAPTNRVWLPVTDRTETPQFLWYQVVLDPAKDRRGWIAYRKLETPSVEPPNMEYRPVETWIGSTGFLQARRFPRPEPPPLRVSPADNAPAMEGQSPDIDLARVNVETIIDGISTKSSSSSFFRFLGIQGSWARVEKLTPQCRSLNGPSIGEKDNADRPVCAEGWLRWRDDAGRLLLLPSAVPEKSNP